MLPTWRWVSLGRALLASSALVIYAALPGVLGDMSGAARTALLAGVCAFAVVWVWFWWWAVDVRGLATVGVVLATALLAVLTFLAPPGRDGLLLAALAAGAAFTGRRAVPVVIVIALLAGTIQVIHGVPPLTALGGAVNDLVVGVAAIGGRLLLATNRELARAWDEVARLAASEERLRLARDLHDLLGQDLTLAVLKSEVVARDLPEATSVSVRALQAEVTVVLRQALDDLRAAVAGYRHLDIQTELAATRTALAGAGVGLDIEDGVGALPQVQANTLAWVLRESVTNVLRHSGARCCVVRLRREEAMAVLEVEDDGGGRGSGSPGSGLTGIAERVAALGGSLETSGGDGQGYRVRVAVPLPSG